MSLKNVIPSEELDDILWELSVSEKVDPEVVKATIARHPEFGREILEFAVEWIEADAMNRPGSGPLERHLSSDFTKELESFWEGTSVVASDPFDGVKPAELRALAQDCQIHVTVLMQLRSRLIDAATVPLVLIEQAARRLRTTPSKLLQFFEGEPELATADFKSPKGPPRTGPKISFAEAIENSPVDDSLKAKWRL